MNAKTDGIEDLHASHTILDEYDFYSMGYIFMATLSVVLVMLFSIKICCFDPFSCCCSGGWCWRKILPRSWRAPSHGTKKDQ